jgi:hypothetical protein
MSGGELPEPPDDSVAGTPKRRPESVRRTGHINMVWPGGFGTPMQLQGRAQDLLTPASGEPVILAEAEMTVDIGDQRTVQAVSVSPYAPGAQGLVGARGGERFRTAIDAALTGERQAGTPLYFLLDDIAGATLIGGFAWSQHRTLELLAAPPPARRMGRDGRIICSGLRPDGYYEQAKERGDPLPHFLRTAAPLEEAGDPWAWHEVDEAPAVCMRRRRRIDAWREEAEIRIDLHFRDSLWSAQHVETVVHEYTVQAGIDSVTGTLTSIDATPRVLPFPECPLAAPHATELVGRPVATFRVSVQDTLTELHCCTHLNDAIRGLAEVPAFSAVLG